ncbi:DUF4439 domain-containing protein [Actinomadura macrotermitis]|uniref:DUF4439 domain-containing protein n=1 Tax=Actinomadura macrotermitis TaxID=2585200 RepID=A0A7K0BNU4_9ACTN|nr:hypothetical protein [Actinomadura macrotermitis]
MSSLAEALQEALQAEHAAVYGYGVLGARLRDPLRTTARTLWDAHRTARDELAARVGALGARPEAAAPAYRLPVRVDSARSAAQLAAALEDALVTAYAGLAGVPDPRTRQAAAQKMQQAIARAVAWRGHAGAPAAGPAFPGLPAAALAPRPRPGE